VVQGNEHLDYPLILFVFAVVVLLIVAVTVCDLLLALALGIVAALLLSSSLLLLAFLLDLFQKGRVQLVRCVSGDVAPKKKKKNKLINRGSIEIDVGRCA
jgi:uncharacterized protein YqhQ